MIDNKKGEGVEDRFEDRIDYVSVEMVRVSDISTKRVSDMSSIKTEKGVFLGIVLKDNIMFIATTNTGYDINLYNIDTYNISMIEYGDHRKKYFLVYTKEKEDQNDSVDILGSMLTHFYKTNRLVKGDDRLIDISTLKNHGLFTKTTETVKEKHTPHAHNYVPDRLHNHIPDYEKQESNFGRGGIMGRVNNIYNDSYYDDIYSYPTVHKGNATNKYEKSFSLFSRKSDKPSKKKMIDMMNRVRLIFENKGNLSIDKEDKGGYIAKSKSVGSSSVSDTMVDEDSDDYMKRMMNDEWGGGILDNMPH